jgi:hypothetical protein
VVGLLDRLGYGFDAHFTWIAALCGAAGVLLVARAAFPERWRRLKRIRFTCPRCRYDLRGIARGTTFPVKCTECGAEFSEAQLRRKPRPKRRMLAAALVMFAAAHVTALWPQVRRVGAIRLIPSTALVFLPMDVNAWIDVRVYGGNAAGKLSACGAELDRRLDCYELWSWQESLLVDRVARACRRRDDYGITPAQYDTVVRLHTTRAAPQNGETVSERLQGLAETAGVPFHADLDLLSVNGIDGDDPAGPADPDATVARALEAVIQPDPWPWVGLTWDITSDGAVVVLWSKDGSTTRCRYYDVSDLVDTRYGVGAMEDMVLALIMPDAWIPTGGSVNACTTISDHLVVVATARAHLQIEDLLDGLRNAIAAGPPESPPVVLPADPRVVTPDLRGGLLYDLRVLRSIPAASLRAAGPSFSDDGTGPPTNPRAVQANRWGGMLNDLRLLRTIPHESIRSAGPALRDGVTEQELDACGRAAFGLLDTLREPPDPPPSH